MARQANSGGSGGGVRAVLLDALGTLVYLEPPAPRLRDALRELAGDGGQRSTQAEHAFRAEIGHYLAHHTEGGDGPGLDRLRDDCAEVMRAALPQPAPDHAVVREAMLAALSFVAFPDVVPALRELRGRGMRLVVVSNWDCSLPEWLEGAGLCEPAGRHGVLRRGRRAQAGPGGVPGWARRWRASRRTRPCTWATRSRPTWRARGRPGIRAVLLSARGGRAGGRGVGGLAGGAALPTLSLAMEQTLQTQPPPDPPERPNAALRFPGLAVVVLAGGVPGGLPGLPDADRDPDGACSAQARSPTHRRRSWWCWARWRWAWACSAARTSSPPGWRRHGPGTSASGAPGSGPPWAGPRSACSLSSWSAGSTPRWSSPTPSRPRCRTWAATRAPSGLVIAGLMVIVVRTDRGGDLLPRLLLPGAAHAARRAAGGGDRRRGVRLHPLPVRWRGRPAHPAAADAARASCTASSTRGPARCSR